MGLVKISETMHANLRVAGQAFSRSINSQAEHWLRIGMLAELNPGLGYPDLCRLLLDAEANGTPLLEGAGAASARLDAGKAAA